MKLENVQITRKVPAITKSGSDKQVVSLATVRANLVLGIDKGGEFGVMLPWSRLSRADASITSLKEYITSMARDLATYASTL